MNLGEAFRFSWDALKANKLRTMLTGLGLVIGNASVILVVTISITARDYILDQIRGIGSNLIYAYYEAGNRSKEVVEADFIKLADVDAVRNQLGDRIVAATGVITEYDRMTINGKEEDIAVLGSDDQYRLVRNLAIPAGRFMDAREVLLREKVAMLTEKLAKRLFGSQQASVGQQIKVHGLQFTVIGTFKERTESFGLSELSGDTILIPITVIKYFTASERIDPMYIQVKRTEEVVPLSEVVRNIVESRHRQGARYRVDSLAAILDTASSVALVLTLVLVMVSAIALIISGIGIMNIMLVTVTERTREIGVRMAVGASKREIQQQFLLEAVLISLAGGALGIVIGLAIPLSVGVFVDTVQIPISPLSVAVAFGVSFAVGIIFGLLPANRAAQLNPTEALRYE